MQGEKREVLPAKSLVNYGYQMKAFITEIRMELESSLYCVWLLSNLHFRVAEPANPPLHKIWQVCNTDETLQGIQIWTVVHGLRTSRPGLTPLYDLVLA